jgi:hypothetical protein
MARPAGTTRRERRDETFEQRLEQLRPSREEREQMVASMAPFDYDAWLQEAGPATPEELAEMEEFLREREAERKLYSPRAGLRRLGSNPDLGLG